MYHMIVSYVILLFSTSAKAQGRQAWFGRNLPWMSPGKMGPCLQAAIPRIKNTSGSIRRCAV